ncbi:energy transducer TonB [Roseomonas sp. F4]
MPLWLALSGLLHAAAVLAALMMQREPLPAAAEQQVALVWAEPSPGAGDAADSAGSSEAAREPPPPEPPAPPPPVSPPMPEPPAPEPTAPEPPPVAPPEPTPAEPAQAEAEALPPPPPSAPPPPPPAPRPPPRAAAAPPAREAPGAPAADGAAATTPPMASGSGEVSGAVVPPRQLGGAANPPPEYPYASRIRNEQGQVTLRLEIDTIGGVTDVRVLRSAGYPALDQAAMQAVRRWRFEPAMRDGVPVFSSTSIGITFQLEGDRRW